MASHSEVANLVRASDILSQYKSLNLENKKNFFEDVAKVFTVDEQALEKEIKHWLVDKQAISTRRLHRLSEPSSQELFRTLNFAPNATVDLVNMRADLLQFTLDNPALKALDNDFLHLFVSWFNRGFLELRCIDWSTPANILEKLIAYEAVHEIRGWDDLRQRVADCDRGLYAYFHPALGDDPLIFVQVAFMADIPSSIDHILRTDRNIIQPQEATTAVFYSISNCQSGLRGVSFGNFLIKQVVETVGQDFPNVHTFITLSPVLGFRRWALAQLDNPNSVLSLRELNAIEDLSLLDVGQMDMGQAKLPENAKNLPQSVAKYLVLQRCDQGLVFDPVARFHLGNGAHLQDIHPLADTTQKGWDNSWGCMVNYQYALADIERNHHAYYNQGHVATSDKVAQLAGVR